MNILKQLLQIIALKRRPQDIEYDEFSAVFYVVAAVGLGYLLNNTTSAYSKPLQYSLVQNLSHAAVLYGFLALKRKQNRFVQTCTALFGVSVILQLISLVSLVVPALAPLSLFIAIWIFYLSVLIICAATDSSMLSAVFISMAISLASIMVVITVYPEFMQEVLSIVEVAKEQTS